MPELSLSPDGDFLFVRGFPNQTRPDEIDINSKEAEKILEEAANETGTTFNGVKNTLTQGKTIEY